MTASTSDKKPRRNRQSETAAKINELYDSQDVIKLYGINRNTLLNWIKAGLTYIESEPRLFLGADLNAFQKKRNGNSRKNVGAYEGYCPGCRTGHSLLVGDIRVKPMSTGNFRVYRACPDGAGEAGKWFSKEDLAVIYQLRESNPGA